MNDGGSYGRFGAYSRVELERFFHLDDEDRRLIAARRRDYNRLGFALQVVAARHLGMFLPDPLDVPPELVGYLAGQLGIEDPTCVKRYTDREKTKLEHAWEIQREYGLTPFAEVESELTAWISDQAWMTGEGPKAIFSGAMAWLRGRQALLPAGVTTLERMVATGRESADQRLWQQLTSPLTPQTSGALLGLLDVPDAGKQRVNELDRLRKGLFRTSSKGMVAALNRVADLVAVGAGSLDVSTVPPRRLLGLAMHGIAGKTTLLRRMSREHRLAVLVATVLALAARATDDALELFDLVMTTELLSKAERESKDEKLRRYPRVSRNAGKLAAAVKVMLEMSEVEPDISLELVWDLIENGVTKSELRAAVAVIDELVPAGDAELNGRRLEELAGRLATVRPFLPLMMRTIEFGATADGAPVLKAMTTLADLLTTKSKLPATYLDARRVDHDLITGGWSRLIYREGRPPETVDRAAYTLCVLEQFHRRELHTRIDAAIRRTEGAEPMTDSPPGEPDRDPAPQRHARFPGATDPADSAGQTPSSGHSSPTRAGAGPHPMNPTTPPAVRVQLLHVPDCPLVERVRDTLTACLHDTLIPVQVEELEGEYPSPTLVIAGRDVATGQPPQLVTCCRLDLPTYEQIWTALNTAIPTRPTHG
ncbi:DUF4158 domain-containing protein [Antrihabitans spumae]|uniref:DUF4158 domain-containing protein n=1 Tax=Antrihabitans spumae TaxID=3373370 RepID=A0ABW7KSE9_9NOCA